MRNQLAPGGKGLNSPSFSSTPELHGKPGGKGFKRGGQEHVSSLGAWEEASGRLSTLQRCCATAPLQHWVPLPTLRACPPPCFPCLGAALGFLPAAAAAILRVSLQDPVPALPRGVPAPLGELQFL